MIRAGHRVLLLVLLTLLAAGCRQKRPACRSYTWGAHQEFGASYAAIPRPKVVPWDPPTQGAGWWLFLVNLDDCTTNLAELCAPSREDAERYARAWARRRRGEIAQRGEFGAARLTPDPDCRAGEIAREEW